MGLKINLNVYISEVMLNHCKNYAKLWKFFKKCQTIFYNIFPFNFLNLHTQLHGRMLCVMMLEIEPNSANVV